MNQLQKSNKPQKSTLRISILLIALCGCSSPPRSIDQLRLRQADVTSVCSELPADQVVGLLTKAWATCFVSPPSGSRLQLVGNVPVLVPGSPQPYLGVYDEATAVGRSVVTRSTSGVIMLVADLTTTSTCKTMITVRGWDDSWGRRAAHTQLWLKDPNDAGPSAPYMLGGCQPR